MCCCCCCYKCVSMTNNNASCSSAPSWKQSISLSRYFEYIRSYNTQHTNMFKYIYFILVSIQHINLRAICRFKLWNSENNWFYQNVFWRIGNAMRRRTNSIGTLILHEFNVIVCACAYKLSTFVRLYAYDKGKEIGKFIRQIESTKLLWQ